MPNVLAQSLANAIKINDINYILLKRKNGSGIPPLHPRDQFAIFAKLDNFLGGSGLLNEKPKFWRERGLAEYGVPRKLDQGKRAAYYARCKKEGDYEQALQQRI